MWWGLRHLRMLAMYKAQYRNTLAIVTANRFQMGAWFCPCFLYGRLSARYKALPNQSDSMTNGSCSIWFLSSCIGLWWVPQMLRRQEMRQRFDIEGNGCTDFLVTACCGPCSLAQMNMEMKEQAGKPMRGTKDSEGYGREQQHMIYNAQQPPPA